MASPVGEIGVLEPTRKDRRGPVVLVAVRGRIRLFGVEEALNFLSGQPGEDGNARGRGELCALPNSSCATSAYTRLTSSKNAFAENPFRKQMRIKGRSSVSRVVRSASVCV